MKAIKNRTIIISTAATAMLGLALISLASCSSGESTTPAVTTGGSAALQGPLVFVHNSTARTTSVVALRGDTGNSVIRTMGNGVAETGHPNGAYNGNAPGDMQFSEGEWVFVNVGGIVPGPGVAADTVGSSVALIDPLSGATPIFEDLLQIGERPVHIYRDPTDGEVIWSMIDGNATTGLDSVSATIKDSGAVVDCSATGGGAVTILHNSHIGPGGNVPKIIGKICLLAAGHKVTAFSQPTVSNPANPKLAFVSSTTAGEVSVIDNLETLPGGAANPNYLKLIARVDLCDSAKEALRPIPAACNNDIATPLTSAFSLNNSNPHGIRFSKATGRIYSIQENYRTIVEIDPTAVVAGPGENKAAITRTLELTGMPYTSFGITPDGRFLFVRGVDTTTDPAHVLGKIGVVDLAANPLAVIPFNLPEMTDVVPSTFKFAPNGQRLYMLAANTATGTLNQPVNQKKNLLFAYDSSAFPAAPTLLRPIGLLSTTGNHNFDIYADGPAAAGSAKYVVVSNGSTENSVSIINATTNQITQSVPTGNGASTVMVYYPDAALNNNQATASLTGGSKAKPSVLPERLDDHGMPE